MTLDLLCGNLGDSVPQFLFSNSDVDGKEALSPPIRAYSCSDPDRRFLVHVRER